MPLPTSDYSTSLTCYKAAKLQTTNTTNSVHKMHDVIIFVLVNIVLDDTGSMVLYYNLYNLLSASFCSERQTV